MVLGSEIKSLIYYDNFIKEYTRGVITSMEFDKLSNIKEIDIYNMTYDYNIFLRKEKL